MGLSSGISEATGSMFSSIKARLALILLLPLLFSSLTALAETPPPADKVFALNASRDGDGAVRLSWSVAPGAYLYRDSLKASLSGRDLALAPPPGETKDDPNFGPVEIYHGAVALVVAGLPASGALDVTYQGCADTGICYPPVRSRVDLASLAVTPQPRASLLAEATEPPAPQSAPAKSGALGAADTKADAALSDGLLAVIPAFVGFGLLLAFTPCVFPMIPILSGILVGSGQRSPWRGLALSSAYVLAMATAYGLAGLVAGWSGNNLQALLQTPLVLGLSAAVFVALALSMFGLFDLAIPSFIATRMARLPMGGGSRDGSLGGAALIGFGSALVIGPCVTPPLAAAMLYAIDRGDAARGGLALFSLGLGMGLPLVLAGTFGARLLPKAGPWLADIRRLFGLVFLGVAAMLAARLMPPSAALALWGVSAIIVATFLDAFDRLDKTSPWNARLTKAAGLTAALYGALLIIGAAGGGTDPVRPLAFLSGGIVSETSALRLTPPADFDRVFADKAARGKPVLVLFTADWCTVCKSNEKVLAAPDLSARLADTPRIAVDITDQTTEAESLMTRFRVVGPPALFLLDADGREIPGSRLIGALESADLTARLTAAGA